jgi:branched-chain amino acid aminotransferase
MIYLNGETINEDSASISVGDMGFLQGDGLFETMRAYNGKIFALDAHMDRLIRSAEFLAMVNIPSKKTLADACNGVVAANRLKEARVRLTITRGIPGSLRPTVLVTAEKYLEYSEEKIREGISAITLSGYSFSDYELSHIKSTGYQRLAMARKKAELAGCDEAILINEKGNVSEGSFTNVFVIDGQKIVTPPLSDGLLSGITRAIVLKLAKENGYETEERSISLESLYGMNEVFVTNSLIELVPVKTIDQKTIGKPSTTSAPATNSLLAYYKNLIGIDLI